METTVVLRFVVAFKVLVWRSRQRHLSTYVTERHSGSVASRYFQRRGGRTQRRRCHSGILSRSVKWGIFYCIFELFCLFKTGCFCNRVKNLPIFSDLTIKTRGYQLLEFWLLDNQLVDTFGRKSTAWHKIFQLLKLS